MNRRSFLCLPFALPLVARAANTSTTKDYNHPKMVMQINEWFKCANDPAYFIEKYVRSADYEKGLTTHSLYEWQKQVITQYQSKNVLGVLPRQSGKTALEVGIILHLLIFPKSAGVALVSSTYAQSRHILHNVKIAYNGLPPWLRAGVKTWNHRSIEMDNGNWVGIYAGSAIRGRSYTHLIMDEPAFMRKSLFEDTIVAAYPVRARTMMLSTPNGMNHYHAAFLRNSQRPEEWFVLNLAWYEIRDKNWDHIQDLNKILPAKQMDQEYWAKFV